jgi:hypothetical protein
MDAVPVGKKGIVPRSPDEGGCKPELGGHGGHQAVGIALRIGQK